MTTKRCHDCDCSEGEFHAPGCDMEVCPFCKGQLLSCDCRYELLGMDPATLEQEYPAIYNNGLPNELADAFDALLEIRGRIRYYQWPVLCAYCGDAQHDFFSVPDEDWHKYVPESHWREVLCRPCYDHFVAVYHAAEEKAHA